GTLRSNRLGRESRNYADLKAVERVLAPEYMVSAEHEWVGYERVICRSLGVPRLEPIPPRTSSLPSGQLPNLSISFHEAEMNTLPYLVTRVGGNFGSPAPVFMTWGHEQESALARLMDVFRIGVRGQAFRDFVEAGRRLGKKDSEIATEWRECEQAVAWRRGVASAGAGHSLFGLR